jgi:hypothetical protein
MGFIDEDLRKYLGRALVSGAKARIADLERSLPLARAPEDSMDLAPLSGADFALLLKRMAEEHLVIESSSTSKLFLITCDSMTLRFPGEGAVSDCYQRVLQLLRETAPHLHWVCEGKCGNCGCFASYVARS